MKKLTVALMMAFSMISMFAEPVSGTWKTIDDGTGEAKSIVKIYEKGGKIYGDIVEIFNEDPNYDPLCTECSGSLKNQKIIGMTIINGLEKTDDNAWYLKKGIIDPDNGKWYDVKIWREGNKLMVRGYIGFIYRTQTWMLVE